MVEEKIESLSNSSLNQDSSIPESASSYPVADQQDMTKFSKLFYQTGRLHGADKYIWISPFIRYSLNLKFVFYNPMIHNFLNHTKNEEESIDMVYELVPKSV